MSPEKPPGLLRRCLWLAGLLACELTLAGRPGGAALPDQARYPSGIFALSKAGRPIPDRLLVDPSIAGIVLRQKWEELVPVEGQYDWTYLDEQFSRIGDAGKQVSLVLTYGGRATPAWLLEKDIRLFEFTNANAFSPSYQQAVRIPLFWDEAALEYKKALIAELGARYRDRPGFTMVSAQCVNALTGDWNMPHRPEDLQQWRELDFQPGKLVDACTQIIDATMAAFPNQFVKMALGPVSVQLDPEPTGVAEEIIRYATERYPGRFIAQRNNLSAATPDPRVTDELHAWSLIWNNRPAVAAQMLWNARDTSSCRLNGKRKPCQSGTMLREAVEIGMAYDVRHLEIYAVDLLNDYGNEVKRDAALAFMQRPGN